MHFAQHYFPSEQVFVHEHEQSKKEACNFYVKTYVDKNGKSVNLQKD
jgi:hypothetical protein